MCPEPRAVIPGSTWRTSSIGVIDVGVVDQHVHGAKTTLTRLAHYSSDVTERDGGHSGALLYMNPPIARLPVPYATSTTHVVQIMRRMSL